MKFWPELIGVVAGALLALFVLWAALQQASAAPSPDACIEGTPCPTT